MSQTFVDALSNTSGWSEFASGVDGAIAYGAPSLAELNQSLGRSDTSTTNVSGDLFIVQNETFSADNNGYWLRSYTYSHGSSYCYRVNNKGQIGWIEDAGGNYNGIRPLVCLPTETMGTIGNTVSIKK